MKNSLAPLLTVLAVLAAGVVAVTGTLAGIHRFAHSESRTVEATSPPAATPEPLLIVSAKYSFGSQSADVTRRVRELISRDDVLWANPGCLHADPHPYMNKALVIVYAVEGKPAVLSVGENEKVDTARLLKNAASAADSAVAQARANH